MDQKLLPVPKILLIIVSALVVILTIFFAGYYFGTQNQRIITSNAYQAGWDAARQKLEEARLLPPEPEEIFTISGTIIAISENQISLKANQVVVNPLASPAPEERIIIVTPETKIVKLIYKTTEEIAKESDDFRKAMAEFEPGAAPPIPPLPYKEEEINLDELKAGDTISVTADKNIKFATQFEAKEISASVTPERPTPPML